MVLLTAIILGFILDFIFGDPRWLPHPICFIGKLISVTEKAVRRFCGEKPEGLLMGGFVLVVIVLTVTFAVPYFILTLAEMYSPVLAFAVETFMFYQIFAMRSLKEASLQVYEALKSGDLQEARKKLSWIVGRDTAELTDEEVAKAQSDPDYAKNTGIDNYTGFPIYGTGSYSEDGFPYTPTTKESVIANYNTAEKEGCEAMGFEMLTDMFAQPEEFDLLPYSALWAYQQPQELAEKQTILDEIAWPGLVKCVTGTEDEFDANWESMVQELTDNGLADAEEAKAVLLAPANVDCGFSIVENNELKDRIISSIKDFSGIL